METELPLPAIRFNALIAELCHVLNAHGGTRFIEQPVLLLIWNRVTRMARLFAGLAERVRAGTLAAVAPARSRGAEPGPGGRWRRRVAGTRRGAGRARPIRRAFVRRASCRGTSAGW